jgi:hypothetical protein
LLLDRSHISFESLLLILNGYIKFWHGDRCVTVIYEYGVFEFCSS